MAWFFGLFGSSHVEDEEEDEIDHDLPSEHEHAAYQHQQHQLHSPHDQNHQQQSQSEVYSHSDEQHQHFDEHHDNNPINPAFEATLMDPSIDDSDPSLFDPALIAALRSSLRRKDEQLMQLEDEHHKDLQSVRSKYSAQIVALTAQLQLAHSNKQANDPSSPSPDELYQVESSIIHSHPDYLNLHSQYSRLFEEYHALQAAYTQLDQAQQTLMQSLREEVEYEIRQSLHAQYEESMRRVHAEREQEHTQWQETHAAMQAEIDRLTQLQSTSNEHHISEDADNEEREEKMQSLTAEIASLQASLDTERYQMNEELQRQSIAHDSEMEQMRIANEQLYNEVEQLKHSLSTASTQSTESSVQAVALEQAESRRMELESFIENQRNEIDRLNSIIQQLQHEHQQQQQINQSVSTTDTAELSKLQAIIDDQAGQISMLESHLNQAPTHENVHALQVQVQALTGELARKDTDMQTMHKTIVSKLEQVKAVIAKKDAQIQQLRQQAMSQPMTVNADNRQHTA